MEKEAFPGSDTNSPRQRRGPVPSQRRALLCLLSVCIASPVPPCSIRALSLQATKLDLTTVLIMKIEQWGLCFLVLLIHKKVWKKRSKIICSSLSTSMPYSIRHKESWPSHIRKKDHYRKAGFFSSNQTLVFNTTFCWSLFREIQIFLTIYTNILLEKSKVLIIFHIKWCNKLSVH